MIITKKGVFKHLQNNNRDMNSVVSRKIAESLNNLRVVDSCDQNLESLALNELSSKVNSEYSILEEKERGIDRLISEGVRDYMMCDFTGDKIIFTLSDGSVISACLPESDDSLEFSVIQGARLQDDDNNFIDQQKCNHISGVGSRGEYCVECKKLKSGNLSINIGEFADYCIKSNTSLFGVSEVY